MTSYNTLYKAARAYKGGRQIVLDPGDGGTIKAKQVFPAVCTVTGGTTRVLESATLYGVGDSLLVISQTSTITVNSVALADGEHAEFVVTLDSNGAKQWVTNTTTDIQNELNTIEAYLERAVVSEIASNRWRIWNSLDTQLSATPASADDLAYVIGTYLTDSPYVTTTAQTPGDANPVISYARVLETVPHNYIAGSALTVRIAWSRPDAAATSMALDLEVVRVGAPTVDVQSTAAVNINGAASGTADFVLTPTNIVPGEVLNIRVNITAVSNGASYEGRILSTSFVYTPAVIS